MGLADERGDFGGGMHSIAQQMATELYPEVFSAHAASHDEARRRRIERLMAPERIAPVLQLLIDKGLLDETELRDEYQLSDEPELAEHERHIRGEN